MDNSKEYWQNLAKKIEKPSDTKNKRPDTSDLEIEFLKEYVSQADELLDIGSGTGLIVNKLLPYVKSIVAVEKFEGFTKHIIEDENMLVINSDLIGFNIRKTFDSILCTGVAQCFSKADMIGIYKNMHKMLKKGGFMLLRIHCGLEEDVVINNYSDELKLIIC